MISEQAQKLLDERRREQQELTNKIIRALNGERPWKLSDTSGEATE